MSSSRSEPLRVAAVLVVCDGVEWLNSVLATLATQRYPALDLVVVDNASRDGSAEVLARRIPHDHLLSLRRNVGFGRAVAAALNHPVVAGADYLLLVHDDLALAPDAVERLVAAVESDDTLSIVGPKLREWSDELVLAEVGMTIDRFGRAQSRVEPGELDQGQHDGQDEVLYVSTAGMLLHREVLRSLGGFDARFPAFRDDLDLCWRAWMYGHRVEVVPEAVGYHIGAGRAGRRSGRASAGGRRYLAERHAMAALLKHYGPLRLAWTAPLAVVLALVKTLLFVALRRFADAGAVLRGLAWNLGQLPRTLRRRRTIQRRRRVADADLARLFARGLPGLRGYAGAAGAWVAGGGTRALMDDRDTATEDRLADRVILRFMRDHPAAVAGTVLLITYLAGVGSLLLGGQVVGGQVAPWPASPRAFLAAYASPFNGDPVGTLGFASPAQALLGVLSLAGFGSAWLAQRLLVFGLVPLAWLLALRAGRLITPRAGPRALGATLYAASPVLLGALGRGQYGLLVGGALLPGLVLVTARAVDPRVALDSAWRAAALLALGVVAVVAGAPAFAPLLALTLAATAAVAGRRGGTGRAAAVRVACASALAVLALSPWLYTLVASGSLAAALGPDREPTPLPVWRAATAVPDVLPGLGGTGGVVAAATSVAVAVAGVVLGLRRRPELVAGLVGVGTAYALAAWAAARLRLSWLWAPGMLLPTALCLAGLGVVAAANWRGELREHAFGVRQLAVVTAVAVLVVGLLGAVVRLLDGPYDGLTRDPEVVPAFVAADVVRVGPYRVLLLSGADGEVRWDVTGGAGPSMLTYGTLASENLLATLDSAVAGVTGGGDPRAGAGLGVAGVRYLVVTADGDTEALRDALRGQPFLEPLPSGDDRVYRVRSWLPRAVVLPAKAKQRLTAFGDPGDTARLETAGLRRVGPGAYAGEDTERGLLLLGEARAAGFEARADGRALQRADVPGVNAWRSPGGDVAVHPAGAIRHRVVLAVQLLLVLAVVSLTLRPPGFTQHRQVRRRGGDLPASLQAHTPEVAS